MAKKPTEMEIYWKNLKRKMVAAVESNDNEALTDLAMDAAISAKSKGVQIDSSVKEVLEEAGVKIPATPSVTKPKYSVLPWVKAKQQEEYKQNMEFARKLQQEDVVDDVIEIYRDELSKLDNGEKLDNERFRQIKKRFDTLTKGQKNHALKSSFIVREFSKRGSVRKKQIVEAEEMVTIAYSMEQYLDSQRGVTKFTREGIQWLNGEIALARQAKQQLLLSYLKKVARMYNAELTEQKKRISEGIKLSERENERRRADAVSAERDAKNAASRKAAEDRKRLDEHYDRRNWEDNGLAPGSY